MRVRRRDLYEARGQHRQAGSSRWRGHFGFPALSVTRNAFFMNRARPLP